MAQNQFGRPRTFPMHRDHHQFQYQPDGDHDLVAETTENGSENVRRWLAEQHDDLLPMQQTFFHRAPANFNDPRVLYYVLDAMVRSKPWTYIRAGALAEWLNVRAPQYYWTPVAVGRVLAGVRDTVISVYLETMSDDPDNEYPVAMGRDTISRYYVVDPIGGNEGRLWLLGARKVAYRLAQQQQGYDNIGEDGKLFGTGRGAKWTYYGDLEDENPQGWLVKNEPIRGRDAYYAQATTPEPDIPSAQAPQIAAPDFTNTPNDGSAVRIGG